MKNFFVVYLAPVEGLEAWAKTDPAIREPEEARMREAWNVWMQAHGAHIKETAGLGKTKRVDANGITDTSNGMMLYSIVEAETDEAAADMFKDHPHLQIPGATIEVMPANPLS